MEKRSYSGDPPKARQIIAICAHGDSPKYSPWLLQDKGFDVVSLDGGAVACAYG